MPRRRRILLATSNKRKECEMRRLLGNYDVELESVAPSVVVRVCTT